MTALSPQENHFGPLLSNLNHHILRTAEPITWSNVPQIAIIPMIPLGIQAYLLQFGGTRPYRLAIGALGITLMLNAWFGYRFEQPELNAFNNGLGIAYLHLLIKYFEFGLVQEPYIDGFTRKGRGKLRSALDLCINSRMVGLHVGHDSGPVGTVRPLRLTQSFKPNGNGNGTAHGHEEGVSSNEVNGSIETAKENEPVRIGHWLPQRSTRITRTRPQALLRHALLGLQGLWTIDTLLALEKYTASTTLGNPRGTPHAVGKFIRGNDIMLFPGTSLQYPAPSFLVETVVTFAVGTTIWQGLVGGYDVFAFLALLVGWEVESWEVDLMDEPWKAESLLDMWGQRWHQLFRHQFLLIANCILRPFGLAGRTLFVTPLIFILSAIYHSLGELSMSPVPAVIPLSSFFILSGVGCGLESCFKRITGRRVRGWTGRVWTYVFLVGSGRWAAASWLDSGLAGSTLGFPGPGRFIVPFIAETLFKVIPK